MQNSIINVMSMGCMIVGSITMIFMLFCLVKNMMSYTSGRNGFSGIIGNVLGLIIAAGLFFVPQLLKNNMLAKVQAQSPEPQETVAETVIETTIEVAAPSTTTTVISGNEIQKQWEQAIHDEYKFYYNGFTINPKYYDYTKYNIEFNHDKHEVYLSAKE